MTATNPHEADSLKQRLVELTRDLMRILSTSSRPKDRQRCYQFVRSHVDAVEGIEIGAGVDRPASAALQVVMGAELYVPLEGLVDFEKEKKRLAGRLEKAEAELAKIGKKLANENYVSKAPEHIVEKDRARAAELEEVVGKLEAQIDQLPV